MARPLLILMLLAGLACSSGGGGGGDDGGDGTRITRGVVTGLGSVTVAGTVYDTDLAVFEFEREPGTLDDLRLGMRVTVLGSADGNEGTATTVVFDDDLEGPITDIDAVGLDLYELTILDQIVELRRGSTVFDGTDFDSIAGDHARAQSMGEQLLVEVSGLRDGSGTIAATRVELVPLAPGPTPDVELKGQVSNLDVDEGSFEIGRIEILYDPSGEHTDLSDVPEMTLVDGDFVEVEGRLDDPRTINAAVDEGMGRIEIEDLVIADDAEDVELDGIVSNFAGFTFELGGQLVHTLGLGFVGFNSTFEPSNSVFLQDGVRVEVEGELLDGVLFARIIKLRDGRSHVSAEIAEAGDVDSASGTIELLGSVQIDVDVSTRFDGFADLGALDAGRFIVVRGFVLEGVLRATEIKLETEIGEVELFGRVEMFDLAAGIFRVLGLVIPTDDLLTLFAGFPDDAGVVPPEPPLDPEQDFYAFLASNPNVELLVKNFDDDETSLDLADQVTRDSSVRVAAEIADKLDVDAASGTIELLGAVQIQVSDATAFGGFDDLGDLGDLDEGDFIEAHGVFVDGVLSAAEIRRGEVSDDVEVRGRVEDIENDDPLERTFTIMGLVIPTDDETEYDDLPGIETESVFYQNLAFDVLLDVRDETDAPGDMDARTLDSADRVRFRRDDN